MPTVPSPAQTDASRRNGARSALNGVRHGLCGRTFFLLADENPDEFHEHESMWLAVWNPRDLPEQQAAEAVIRAMWREVRADRLEAQVLTDLFAANGIVDDAERQAAKDAAMKALGTLLRYRGRMEREHRAAMDALEALRQRGLTRPPTTWPTEPDQVPVTEATTPAKFQLPTAAGLSAAPNPCGPSEPELPLNRHQRRALAARTRQQERRAA